MIYTIKRFLEPIKVVKREFILSLFCAFLGALYDNGIIMIFEYIARQLELLNIIWFRQWVTWLWVLFVLRFFIRRTYKPIPLSVSYKIGARTDNMCLKKYLDADNNLTETIGSGRIYSVIRRWVFTRSVLLFNVSWWYARTLFTLCVTLIYIASKWWVYLLFAGWTFLFVFVWIYFLADKASGWRNKAKQITTEIDRMFTRWFSSKFEILQQDRYIYETEKDKLFNYQRYTYKVKEKYRQAICYDWASFTWDILILAVVIIIWLQVLSWVQTLADYVVIIGVSILISKAIASLSDIGKEISDQSVHLTKLRDMLDTFSQENTHTWNNIFSYTEGNISLTNISYAYGKGNDVFTNFSLDIVGQQKTALVWSSWSGKSTLIKLISGYLTPNIWTVNIDGQDLASVSLKTYYKHIWYLTQDPSLFDGTIRENLMYGINYETIELDELNRQVNHALKMAKCDFCYELPDQLHTEIGERGIRLSWWQRQRLAIAKIFLKDPKIILLDEPTSSLDSFAEEFIMDAMHNLFTWRTVIVIAHRLQTVKSANDIIVLEDGIVVERGTHTSLMKQRWKYAKMLELQSWF